MPTTATAASKKPAKARKPATRLHYCKLEECEGICCSDGAFLQPDEERLIHRVVAKYPAHFRHLPKDYILDGEWEGNVGRKTAVYKFRYRSKPEHFANTRCAFAEADGKCSLQTLAVALGKQKWAFKPMGCWLFPLSAEEHGLIPPPRTRREDPNNLGPSYPGFVTQTPCGKHSASGKVWWIALKEEVAQFRAETGGA
jgi:hypothetical protein